MDKRIHRFVLLAYAIFSLVLFVLMEKVFQQAFIWVSVRDFSALPFLGSEFLMSRLLAVLSVLLALWIGLKNQTVSQFSHQVMYEMFQVTWPTKKEVTSAFLAVVVIVVITSLFIGFSDLVGKFVSGKILGI